MSSVCLLRDFVEDDRTSMEIYADQVSAALRKQEQSEFNITSYRPSLSPWISRLPQRLNLRMRAARYLDFPSQAANQRADIFHVLDHGYAHVMRNLDPARVVVTVHDIIPVLAGRGLMHGVRMGRRNWLSEYSAGFLRRAGQIIAISESTKRDLQEYLNCDPARINLVYYGIDKAFRPFPEVAKAELRKQLGLPEDGSLVLITGQQYYKNQGTSLKVMEELQSIYQEGLKMVRLGRQTAEWEQCISNSTFRDHVIHLDYLPKEQMPLLYAAVDCLLFPSWYEGFGWPPVEAMACGTPAVTSNVASLPEAVGDAGTTRAPDDVAGLAEAVDKLLSDEAFRKEKIEQGLKHVKRYDWDENAAQLLKVYRKMRD